MIEPLAWTGDFSFPFFEAWWAILERLENKLALPSLSAQPSTHCLPQVSFQSQIQKPSPPLTMLSAYAVQVNSSSLPPFSRLHPTPLHLSYGQVPAIPQMGHEVPLLLPPMDFPPPETFFPAFLLLINFYDTHPFVSLAVSRPYSLLVTATLLTSFLCVHTHRHSTAFICGYSSRKL